MRTFRAYFENYLNVAVYSKIRSSTCRIFRQGTASLACGPLDLRSLAGADGRLQGGKPRPASYDATILDEVYLRLYLESKIPIRNVNSFNNRVFEAMTRVIMPISFLFNRNLYPVGRITAEPWCRSVRRWQGLLQWWLQCGR